MGASEGKSFDSPDETREFAKGKLDVVKVGGSTLGRYTLEPGWKWSESVKPIVGTDTCQQHHLGYVVSGRLKSVTDQGQEIEAGPGDAYEIEPGHDSWVVGDETWVGLEFQSKAAETYGKK